MLIEMLCIRYQKSRFKCFIYFLFYFQVFLWLRQRKACELNLYHDTSADHSGCELCNVQFDVLQNSSSGENNTRNAWKYDVITESTNQSRQSNVFVCFGAYISMVGCSRARSVPSLHGKWRRHTNVLVVLCSDLFKHRRCFKFAYLHFNS